MMRGILTIGTFLSVLLFPWPLAAVIAFVSGFSVPFLPLAAGLFADTLYYAPHAHFVPLFTILGACASAGSYLVRRRLGTSIIRR